MGRRSIWQRLAGRVERVRAIRRHEQADRELLQRFAGGVLPHDERAAMVERMRSPSDTIEQRIERWTKLHPGWKDRVVREAEEPLRGELSLFGKTYQLLDPAAWHGDPDGLRVWPQDPHMRLRLDEPRLPGDVRMQWEPARFHHALRLGRAYLATGHDDYASAFLRQVDSFEAGNRPFESIHWAVGMEVAIRAANWTFAIELFRGCDLFTPDRCEGLVDLLLLHGLFLEHHIETHVAGTTNHTLADHAGLIVLARALEGTAIARHWLDNAAPALEAALAQQTLEGGAHSEGSLPYERFVLETCLVAHSNLDESRREKLGERLLSMARHLRAATLSGRLPFVGDGDDSVFPPFGMRPLEEIDPLDPEPLLQLAAHELGDDRLRSESVTAEEAFWMGVPAEAQTLTGPRSPGTLKTTGFIRFEVGAFEGLVLVRSSDEGWIPTHGHNDNLSIVLNYGGQPLLTDPGTGGYAWDRELRHALRSTASHSTLQVDKVEQSPISAARTFEGTRTPRCEIASFRPDPLEVTATCHFGTEDLAHERAIRSESGLIRIEDRLLASGNPPEGSDRRSTVRLVFAPGLTPVQVHEHPSIWGVETPTGTVRFLFLHPSAADWQSPTVPASQRYGSKELVASLVGSFNGPLNHRWVTFIAPPTVSLQDLAALVDEQATEGE